MESLTQVEQTIKSPKVVNLVKAAIMTMVTTLSAIVAKNGYPSTSIGWEYLGITVFISLIFYLAINAITPSNSVKGQMDWADMIKGMILAVCAAVSGYTASKITGTAVDIDSLLKLSESVAIGYFIKNMASEKGVPTFMLGLLPANLKQDVAAADVAVGEEKTILQIPPAIGATTGSKPLNNPPATK